MKPSTISVFSLRGLALSGIALALAGCAGQSYRTMSEQQLQAAYQAAVQDAAVAEPDEISRNLTAIVPGNHALVWDNDQSHVLMVTWTAWNGYDTQVDTDQQLSREIWVTAAPQLQQFCRKNSDALRLEQLLGLPPHNGKTRFVELWVQPKDMFRPAPDSEISDHEAEVDFPSSPYIAISNEYKAWFNQLRASSYGDKGYPWTRLGYTYDWGSASHVGLSEFVIRPGATVHVKGVVENAAYCH
ncbi:hypothetical protein QCD60_26850 [Pokkaliibacter sp. MBI-7]|uniref:hypothetical protein n=1 Tax=Pokkaliibacter sp. MBI-7 TaxID=3040600 RepID=UPI00244C3F8B|nr:hypothetical protein [Pokkaliibacter sp. MBI-7]MDH2436155.1 hypothetical protein [Pokkaliibacter sp. MBI-7]